MKKINLIILALILLCNPMIAQTDIKSDSLFVSGTCEQCKDRIEGLLNKMKGVHSATWTVETQMLTVQFDSKETTLEAIEKEVVDAGHDTKNLKTSEKTYNNLPQCCHYVRENLPSSSGPIETIRYRISGMTCAEGCAAGIKGALYKIKGVKASDVDYLTQIATIIYDTRKIKKETLKSTIENFSPSGESEHHYKAEEL